MVARGAAVAALLVAIAVVVAIVAGSGSPYKVQALFVNASQLVRGNRVEIAGQPVGKVSDIHLTNDGRARLTLTIDKDWAPLRQGTTAMVRLQSLSGEANRYVQLMLGPGTSPKIRDGGTIGVDQTRSTVDLDRLFNFFDPSTRAAVRGDIKGFGDMTKGREQQANAAIKFLDPTLSASSRLFAEVNRDQPAFERFLIQTSGLFTTIAERRQNVSGLVDHLATTVDALASRKTALAEAIARLPDFLGRSTTTFANLRTTLNDLDPLVRAAKPVVRKARPLFAELRPFAREAVPTVRDLSRTIRRPGPNNDLVELLRRQPPVDLIANGPVTANGATREGAFPASTKALNTATPELAFARPYSVDLTGWFDDFSASGQYDALGGFSRAGLGLGGLSAVSGLPASLPDQVKKLLASGADLGPNNKGRNSRCPGSDERNVDGSNPFRPSPDYNCDPSQVPIGP